MTIARKRSRSITVDGNKFRYKVSTSTCDKDCYFQLTASIQIAQGNGALLKVNGLITRNYWLDFPYPINDNEYPIIMPRHVEMFIRHGIIDGWKPEIPGPVHKLKFENKEVFK